MRISSPATARLEWYDRNPKTIAKEYFATGVAPHSATVRWTYTVPTGRKFRVEWMQEQIYRNTDPTTVGLTTAALEITPNGGSLENLAYYWGEVAAAGGNAVYHQEPALTLQTGDEFDISTNDASVGGTMEYLLSMKGTEFDA